MGETLLEGVRNAVEISNKIFTDDSPREHLKHKENSLFYLYNT